jgi:prephenate dehydrogenase
MENKHITIVGLGLIGGSLARALREKLGILDITAINRSRQPLIDAISDGTIDRGFNEINEYVYNSDIIFICTPVKKTPDFLKILSGKVSSKCIITDVGSTKKEIVDYVNKMQITPCFIGGHPMAGTEKTGYRESVPHLFENAYYILIPSKSTTDTSIKLMKDIIKGIGAIPVVMNAQEHDRIIGSISHIPHIIASALVNLVKDTDTKEGIVLKLAAGGFKDITRIASSSPEVWENIIMSNSLQIRNILKTYIKILNEFLKTMNNSDSKKIYDFFNTARCYRNSFSSRRKGLIDPFCEIVADVEDKPGMLGKIATLLGDSLINIKNMNISNSREYEKGCLTITLSDPASADKAFKLLIEKGYKVYREI